MAVNQDILFIYIQTEPMNVNAGVGYVYNLYSNLYKVTFLFRGIR